MDREQRGDGHAELTPGGVKLSALRSAPRPRQVSKRPEGRAECGQPAAGVSESPGPCRALTDAATHRHAVLLRVKVVPVPAAAAVKEGRALSFGHVKVPAGDHGAARPGLGLLRAHL